MSKELKIFIKNVKIEMKKNGWSQKRLAQTAGVKEPNLSLLFRDEGNENPTYETMQRLATALGTTIGRLIATQDEINDHSIEECWRRVQDKVDPYIATQAKKNS